MSEKMTNEEFDKEIGRREAESQFKALLFASREATRARASEDARGKEIERLSADLKAAEGIIATLTDQQAQVRESTLTAFHDRDAVIEHLRAQVATLVAGQQRNGEARQQAFRELAEELLAMPAAQHAAHLRRIIDCSEDKP